MRYDHTLAAGGLLFTLTMAWRFQPWTSVRPFTQTTRAEVVSPLPSEYASPPDGDVLRFAEWRASPTERGHFDLFTPPVILIDRENDQLVIAPTACNEQVATEFELELIAVVQEPFRLQLVGYVGDPQSCLGVFENTATGETMVARAGHTFSNLALRVEQFELRRERSSEGDHAPLTQRYAVASLADLTTGETVSLTTLGRRTIGPPRARLRQRATAEVHEVPCGSELTLNGSRFRVGAPRHESAALEVTRLRADGTAETRWLTPLIPGI